jgi:GNAT superfamily N-acetyltransferase
VTDRAAPPLVRPIDPRSASEIEIVAARMRETLVEVLGAARGGSMYSMEWLRDRVRFHLDPTRSTGEVFVAVDQRATDPRSRSVDDAIVGHTIVRVELEESGASIGLFSTTYVVPARRRSGVASALLERGETWMRERGQTRAATYTDSANGRLVDLYRKHGYRVGDEQEQMVKLEKRLRRT